jgi:hypothetical protein
MFDCSISSIGLSAAITYYEQNLANPEWVPQDNRNRADYEDELKALKETLRQRMQSH